MYMLLLFWQFYFVLQHVWCFCYKCRQIKTASTAGFHKSSSSEFQTVGPATEKAWLPNVRGTDSDDVWQIIVAGDQELRTQAYAAQQDMLEPSTEDNDGLSRRTCSPPCEEQSAIAGHHAFTVTDHACTSDYRWSHLLPSSLHASIFNRSDHQLRYGPRSFAATGPSTWNSLPTPLRSCHLISLFRRDLKTELFTRAYH